MKKICLPLIITFLLLSCKNHAKKVVEATKHKTSPTAMVVSAHQLANKVGIEIMKKGGNAVDAMVATQFALAVTYPRAGNIGGGGFMVVRTPDGKTDAIDYREMAPNAANKDMYLDKQGNVISGLSRNGGLAVGVPGTVAGLYAAWKKYGKIKNFSTLVKPAVELAKNGFEISSAEAYRLNKYQADFIKYNPENKVFVKKEKWKAGDVLLQKELAHTLSLIAEKGPAAFYEGETALKIVNKITKLKGIMSLEDLKDYKAKFRTPIEIPYKNYKIISMPPPSSGGIALGQLLKISEEYPLKKWGFQSLKSIHLMVEAEKRVYADRAKYLGDSDYYPVPINKLLNDDYLCERMKDFSKKKATQIDSISPKKIKLQKESFETTHTSVVDKNRMAVSVTTTLNSNFGSKVLVDGAGFFLNNEMDDFSAKPGIPNQFGLIGAEANSIAPRKRMLSSMTPSIVEKDGKLFMVLGSPGGSTIITSVYQVIINAIEYDMNVYDAVQHKRFHHQFLPNHIMYEKGTFSDSLMLKLKSMGHKLKQVKALGLVKAIMLRPDGKLEGAGDERSIDDDVEGY